MTVLKTRIAPSPTGEPHVGTAYSALFNLLLARQIGGRFILRIEDTDQKRSTTESEAAVIEALRWLGLDWDEGPDIGGPAAPYRQSERGDIYTPEAERMLAEGHFFPCFCSAERLEAMRAEQRKKGETPRYDGHCLSLDKAEADRRIAAGEPHVIRMKIPESGECRFSDGVYGEIVTPWASVDMQVVMKSDGLPTYHFANVVDDHAMGITHVARGEEWVPSVPKHILLYQYLGWEPPGFTHLPLLRNPDKSKLSKRKNPTSLTYFRHAGYLAEALVNFLGLAFVSIAEGDELMDFDVLAERFDPKAIVKSGAVFDMQKLDWLNGRWIREKLPPEEFQRRVFDWGRDNDRFSAGLALAQTRATTLGDLPDLMGYLFRHDLKLTAADFDGIKKCPPEECLDILKLVRPIVDTLPDWRRDDIEQGLRDLAEENGRKLRAIMPPLFVALTGSRQSLPIFDSFVLLGRATVRRRLDQAITLLAAGE